MSEVTVLDIPLQNSLTPRVGTYSDEGRQDTTFVYDNNSEEYSLSAVNSTSKGYSFYYPEIPLVAGNDIYLEFDFYMTTSSGSYTPIISMNKSATAGNNVIILLEQDGRYINVHWGSVRPDSISAEYGEWHHCIFGLYSINIGTLSESTYYFLRIDNDIRSNSKTGITVINDITLLGDTTNNTSPGKVSIKNVKIRTNVTGFNSIKINSGNEQLKAYTVLPDEYTSKVKARISFKGIVDNDIEPVLMGTDNDPYNKYIIPDEFNSNLTANLCSGHSYYDRYTNPSAFYSVHYDATFNDYVYEKTSGYDNSGHLTGMSIDTVIPNYFGLKNSENKLCIEFTKAITAWQISPYTAANYMIYLVTATRNDPPDGNYYSDLVIYCTNEGFIKDERGNNLLNAIQTSHAQEAFNIELNVPYKFTVYLEFKPIIRRIICKVFINNQWRYTGILDQDTANLGLDCAFCINERNAADQTKFKLGTVSIYDGYPSNWHEKLNVKYNNNLYYLLCSSTGLYPSRLRAKIDGTTYPILLKHDEDNTNE